MAFCKIKSLTLDSKKVLLQTEYRIFIMGNLFESLKKNFENTPKEILENDWKEIKHLNEIGPDVIEYAKFVREQFGIAVSYSNSDKKFETHKYDVSVDSGNEGIAVDAQYYFAA